MSLIVFSIIIFELKVAVSVFDNNHAGEHRNVAQVIQFPYIADPLRMLHRSASDSRIGLENNSFAPAVKSYYGLHVLNLSFSLQGFKG